MQARYVPALEPRLRMPNFDASISGLQFAILDTLQGVLRTEPVPPAGRFVQQLESIVPEGHLR